MVPLNVAIGETIEADAVTLPIESATWAHEAPLFELDSGEGPKVTMDVYLISFLLAPYSLYFSSFEPLRGLLFSSLKLPSLALVI